MIRGGYGIYADDFTGDLFSQLYGGPFRVTENFTNSLDASGVPQLTFRSRSWRKERSARWR